MEKTVCEVLSLLSQVTVGEDLMKTYPELCVHGSCQPLLYRLLTEPDSLALSGGAGTLHPQPTDRKLTPGDQEAGDPAQSDSEEVARVPGSSEPSAGGWSLGLHLCFPAVPPAPLCPSSQLGSGAVTCLPRHKVTFQHSILLSTTQGRPPLEAPQPWLSLT